MKRTPLPESEHFDIAIGGYLLHHVYPDGYVDVVSQ